jgi:hypothetical protein
VGILSATEWLIIVAGLLAIKLGTDVFRLLRDRRDRRNGPKQWQ